MQELGRTFGAGRDALVVTLRALQSLGVLHAMKSAWRLPAYMTSCPLVTGSSHSKCMNRRLHGADTYARGCVALEAEFFAPC